jgi:hypothetical protein
MRTNRLQKLTLVIAAMLLTTACGKVSLSLDNVLPGPVASLLGLSASAEFVSSSAQGDRTVNSYRVDSSTGAPLSQLVNTTPNGYTFYTTVQGVEVSDLTTPSP